LPIGVFTLDTGRLHDETLALAQQAERRYGLPITRVEPRAEAVAAYVSSHGRDAFYDGVDLRKACCAIRKTEPLARALHGQAAWVTGLRRSQATTRTHLPEQEHDATHGLTKYNPLADWTEGDVWHYIDTHGVPYNPLHDQFYPSIGCAPCTRAISPGEDVRAGRWWWESPDSKECGLHVAAVPAPARHRAAGITPAPLPTQG
ncbi:MAG: phosphoadenylyl-sulfate reductase, partial [Betaproteobacteria bacterium]|nr:phosphoadenylyl-sulfate reductase [Betaproteobacteria bacterium]